MQLTINDSQLHRGNGHSEAPDDWSKVTFDTFTADANALREHWLSKLPQIAGFAALELINLHS